MASTWQSIAERKQAERQARIPKEWLLVAHSESDNVLNVPRECGLLTAAELRITEEYDATALVQQLAEGTIRSVDVTTAFCKRAAIAHQLTNCLTEINFDGAIRQAKALDDFFEKKGKPFGPLHGLPISLKDTFKIHGYDASVGVAALCFNPASSNSALVEVLLSLGAVLYCKTNVPQTMMALDSHNNVFGRTVNPANRHLTPGGSSGGEGALIAMRGSPLGIGTDVGGSIRIPAMCNGLYGVKPSHGRVPYAGQEGGVKAGSSKLSIEATAGPIARSVRDCELLLRVLGNTDSWIFDPEVLSQTWDQQSSIHAYLQPGATRRKPALRVGIVHFDGHTRPLPPVDRVISEVAQSFRSKRSVDHTPIEVIDLDVRSVLSNCLKVSNGLFSVDGANQWFDLLEKTGEPLSPWLQNRLRRRPQKDIDEVRSLQAQKTELQTQFLSVWQKCDVLICPVAPHPVPPVDRYNGVNYTSAFNLLDCPASVLPVREVQEDDLQVEVTGEEALNGWDKINRELWAGDRRVYLGSMLSVQIVAPRLMERRLVEAMAVIEQALTSNGTGRTVGSSKL